MASVEAEDAQFHKLWDEALQAYMRDTNKNLLNEDFIKLTSVDQLCAVVERNNEKFEKFRKRGGKIFTCLKYALKPIELFGNLAAGGASMAFPPSSLIFGAVSYLINSGQGVSAVYDDIIEVFEKIGVFTTRLKVHAKHEMDVKLKDIVIKIFSLLLTICAYATKNADEGFAGRLKHFGKGFLLGKESKVHGWIAQLGSLTDQEVAIVGAMTFSKVQDLSADVTEGFGQQAAGISDIKATMTAMASNDSSKKRDEMLRCALEPEDQNAKRFGKLVDEILPNSGSWIVSEPEFVKCVERKQPVLFICGGPGAGKSFLSCSIIQYLRDQFPQGVGDSSRQSICYFFCKADTPKLKDLNVLLRTVAYQITKNDETFAKYAVSYCNPSVNFFSSREVWRKLFTGFYTGDKKSAVTIVVDGLDECDDEQREMFLDYLAALQEEADESENFKITTILVGRDDLLDEFDAAFNAPVPTIRVSPDKIGKDLESFSKKSLKKVRVARKFKASSQKKIIAQLMQKAAGNFEWVRQAVEELKNQDDEHQITRALEKMPSGLDQMLIYTIERFSKTLSDDKIEDLNTMLFWVACSVDAISLFDLNLILGLSRPGEDGYTDLADVIASRYGSFFTLFLVGEHRGSNKNIQDEESRNRQIRQRLLYLAGDHERDEDAAKKAEAARDLDTPESSDLDDTSEDESDETEVDLKSFVVRFSHTSIREFFLGQFQIPASKIRVEQTGAALKIAKAYLCLIVADDETWDRAWIQNQLALNAAVNVWDVLQRVDIAKTPNEDKVYIAKTLIRMFQEEKILKRWVGADGKIRERWLYSTDLMELIKSWVHDEDVSKVLSTAEASFVDAVDKSARDALVKPEALLFAREWLQGTYWANVSCFKFIHDYLRLLKLEEPKVLSIQSSDYTTKKILKTARWAGYEETTEWIRHVAMVFRDLGHHKVAIEYFKKALELDATSVLAMGGIGLTYAAMGELDQAIEWTLKAADIRNDPQFPLAKGYDYVKVAEWYDRLANRAQALLYYKKTLEIDPSKYQTWVEYLKLLHTEKNFEEIVNILERLNDQESAIPGRSRLTALCFESIQDGQIHSSVFRDVSLQAWLGQQHFRAFQVDEAIGLWERVMQDPDLANTDSEYYWIKELSEGLLSGLYLDKALASLDDPPALEKYTKHLEDMSKVKVKESGANPNITSWFNLRPATIHLGVLYKRLGKLNEARACFREHVKLGIDMLIDDDDSNDFGAYSALGTVFAAADEDIQASAAFQYLVFDRAGDDDDRSPDEGNEEQLETHDKDGTAKAVTTLPIRAAETPGEKVKDEDDNDSASANGHQDDDTRSESGSTEAESALGGGVRGDSDSDDSEFESPFSCDGCDKSIEDALYVCRYCADTAFCPDCFKLRESDTGFSFNVCHIKHPMLFVKQPTIPYKADQVLVGEKVMMLNEWIEQLKGEWQL